MKEITGCKPIQRKKCTVKKRLKVNMLLQLLPAVIVLGIGVALYLFGVKIGEQLYYIDSMGSSGDVEGYAFIASLGGSFSGSIIAFAAMAAGLLLMIWGGIVGFFSILSRIVYRPRKLNVLLCRIFGGIGIFAFALPVPYLLAGFYQALVRGQFLTTLLLVAGLMIADAAACIYNLIHLQGEELQSQQCCEGENIT